MIIITRIIESGNAENTLDYFIHSNKLNTDSRIYSKKIQIAKTKYNYNWTKKKNQIIINMELQLLYIYQLLNLKNNKLKSISCSKSIECKKKFKR